MVFEVFNDTRDKAALLFFVFIYIGLGVLLFVFQEKIIYQPSNQEFNSCPDFREADTVTYQHTRLYHKNISRKIVVFYHGNGGSACDRAFLAQFFQQRGYSYVVPEYAGYSNDNQAPSHNLIARNVQDTGDYLETQDYDEILIVGESIGSLFASYHASLSQPDGVLLISPLTTLQEVARRRLWFYPTSILVKSPFSNSDLLNSFNGPVTILHGDKDAIVPYEMGEKLFRSLNTSQKKFIRIPNVGHNDIFESPQTWDSLHEFLVR